MAPRLRTLLIAPQESTQWISYEPPGNPMSNFVAVLETTVLHIHAGGQIL